MPDLEISNLPSLAEASVQATDPLPIADLSASETKKVTVKDLIEAGVALIDNASIPAVKVGTLGTNQVATAAIQNLAVTTAKIADGAVTVLKIADATITGAKLANNTITATQIAANAIGASELADDAVDTAAIANNAITNVKINNGEIAYAKLNISDGDIPGAKITGNSITSAQIATNGVTATELANNAVDTAAVVDAAITGAKIATDTIESGNIAANAVGASELANNAVDTAAIASNAITTAKIADDQITAAKLADNLAGTILATGAIGSTQIAANAITDSELANNAVDAGAIASNAVTEAKIAANAVTTAKIADGTITPAKLNTSNLDRSINVASGNLGINNAITAATRSGITYNAQGLITGTVALAASDLPLATTSAVGGVSVGTGLTVTGAGALSLSNSVTGATVSGITFNNQGQITAATGLVSANLPTATTSAKGAVAITSGGGLTVDGSGGLTTSTSGISAGTFTKLTVNNKGVATAGTTLSASDIPSLDAAKITTGSIAAARIGNDSIDGSKLSNTSTAIFQSIAQSGYPTAQFSGQILFDTVSEDAFIWDGNAWQAITTLTKGSLVFGGTFNATTSKMVSTTTSGIAAGLAVGSNLPTPSATTDGVYVVVATSGTPSAPAPVVALAPPDYILGVTNTAGSSWNEVDLSQTVAGQIAGNITFTPYGQLSATNVQDALQELETEKMGLAGGTCTGQLLIANTGSIVFEGATVDAYELTLAVADPQSSDKTITFPDITGTLITTGDTNTVTSTMVNGSLVNTNLAANAAIAFSKLAALSSAQILVGNGSSVPTAVAVTGDIGINNAGLTSITAGAIVNADISNSAAITGSKVTTGTTSAVGVLQLTDSAASTSTSTAATPAAVKTAKDAADAAASTANAALPKAGGTMTGNLVIDNAKEIRLSEADGDGANYTGLKAQAQSSDIVLTLPAVAPTTGQVLKSSSTATTLEWATDSATDATKLPLAGGTMSGAIAMGTSKITGLGDPTAAQDAATKTYVDTADNSKLNLSGGALTGNLTLNAQSDVRFADSDSSHYIALQASGTIASSFTLTLPSTDAAVSGYVLASDGSGTLSWVDPGSSSSPTFTGDATLTNDGALVGFSNLNATYTGNTKTLTVTVASKTAAHRYYGSGSSSGYKIGGKESPFLTLTPGRTYKFDQADNSNSGHPLRFYLEANKTTAYTTGVTTSGTAGSSGAYTQIVVSDTTPQILHYQCSAHGFMGNSVQTNSNQADLSTLNATNLSSGTVNVARLGSGSSVTTKFLRGDNTWQTVSSDLVADTTPQLGGNLDVNAKNIIFGDSSDGALDDVAKFGVGAGGVPDLSIYSNGSEGILGIPDGGTLKIKDGSNTMVTFSGASNQIDFGVTTLFIGAASNAYWDKTNSRFNGTITEVLVTANNSTDETVYPLFADGATGSQGAETDTGLTYNPSTGLLTSTGFSGSGASLTALNATNLGSGTVPTARLGSGTASSSTFLRGDGSWQAVTSTTINNNANNRLITGSGTANTLEGESNLTWDGYDLTIAGSSSEKIKLKGTSSPQIRFYESTTGKSAIQWNASTDSLNLTNEQDGSQLRIQDDLKFSTDGSTFYSVLTSNSTLTSSKLSGALPAISGASLTALNASNISSGTISSSRIPTLNQNTTGTSGGFTAGSASNLNSGTLPDARFPSTLPAISGANLTNLPASGGTFTATASGALTNGKGLIINSNGTVSHPAATAANWGNANTALSQSQPYNLYPCGNNVFILANYNGSYQSLTAIKINANNTITTGATVVPWSKSMSPLLVGWNTDDNMGIVTGPGSSNSWYYEHMKQITLGGSNGLTITLGSERNPLGTSYNYKSEYVTSSALIYTGSNTYAWLYKRGGTDSLRLRLVENIVGYPNNQPNVTGYTQVKSNMKNSLDAAWNADTSSIAFLYTDTSNYLKIQSITVGSYTNGSSFSTNVSNATVASGQLFYGVCLAYDSTNQSYFTMHMKPEGWASGQQFVYGRVANVSSGSFYLSSETKMTTTGDINYVDHSKSCLNYNATSDELIAITSFTTNSFKIKEVTIGGTTTSPSFTLSSDTVITTTNNSNAPSIRASTGSDKWILVYSKNSYNDTNLLTRNPASTSITNDNYVGFADGSFSNGATATVQLPNTVVDGLSGLTTGSKYFVGGDGTPVTTDTYSKDVTAGVALSSSTLLLK